MLQCSVTKTHFLYFYHHSICTASRLLSKGTILLHPNVQYTTNKSRCNVSKHNVLTLKKVWFCALISHPDVFDILWKPIFLKSGVRKCHASLTFICIFIGFLQQHLHKWLKLAICYNEHKCCTNTADIANTDADVFIPNSSVLMQETKSVRQ